MKHDTHDIYVVDDDQDFREATCELLEEEGLAPRGFAEGRAMLDSLDPEWDGVILCDVRMGGMDGFDVLKAVRNAAPEVPFIMITGHGDVRLAIAAIKAGAYDFLEKPVQPDVLLSTIRRTLNARKLVIENKKLRRRVAHRGGMVSQLVGRSDAMRTCRKALLNLAPLPVTVTLSGEAGTGKSLAARMLHDYGEGSGEFHVINCAMVDADGLIGVLNDVPPDTDTLFIRAVHKLDMTAQTQLADYLRQQDRPRVILSYTGSLKAPEVTTILSDELLYLVNVATVEMPALRERGRDVYLLLETFLREAAARYEKRLPNVTKEMLTPLGKYDWPGNVRELRNVAERMIIGLGMNLQPSSRSGAVVHQSYEDAMLSFERELLEQTLRETAGRKGAAAERLAIPRKRLYLRMKAVGLLKSGQD
ncbi:sigma-54 dependent transcriptional regulator [Aliiroseovarius sp. S2029]|uniref:sigma-54-dependent transcriptional regulator n=1 Tax=Aliiroseovarius sp. S2029 TaxID=2936988 RepID=UPI0020BDFAA2|nr:sigma-54 dependent transcriptional regulator [Aliiroseovarius sp. S2029]MCK8482595.1 sigma-54 dependent transcriptional regulator [Aliiroseovarius sp. S2029]